MFVGQARSTEPALEEWLIQPRTKPAFKSCCALTYDWMIPFKIATQVARDQLALNKTTM